MGRVAGFLSKHSPCDDGYSLVRQYVKTVVAVFLTNGHGEVFEAEPIYLT
ncbi:hypothetical protein [Streptomyces pratensis]